MKKAIFVLVLVSVLVSACGGGVSCPDGAKLVDGGPNNPQGICKFADGRVTSVVTPQAVKGVDLGQDWKDSKNPIQKIECSLNTTADICK